MSLNRLFSVSPAVNYVAPRYVSMMCSRLVSSGLMMLGRFPPSAWLDVNVACRPARHDLLRHRGYHHPNRKTVQNCSTREVCRFIHTSRASTKLDRRWILGSQARLLVTKASECDRVGDAVAPQAVRRAFVTLTRPRLTLPQRPLEAAISAIA